jgi:thioredoxin reductase (NADPH)
MSGHDLIIVGAGPAGLTAALYAGRSRVKTLVVEMMMPGGWTAVTDVLENYPGVGTVHGVELAQRMAEQAKAFGAETVSGTVSAVEAGADGFAVAAGGETYGARAVIVASGTDFRKLGVPGEAELAGRGVSYCATCDGPFFRDREIAVVGGGDSALQEALYLTNFASRIYLIHRRDEFRAAPILAERVGESDKIECLCSHVVERINGTEGVESIDIRSKKSGEVGTLPVAGVFLFVGLEPRTGFLGGAVETDELGFVLTDQDMKTNVRGLLAAGDCRSKLLRQVSTAVGDGATAAFAAWQFLEEGAW